MKSVKSVLFTAAVIGTVGCQTQPDTLFSLIPPEQSQVTFSNRIIEDDTLNILKEEYVYNGGGVGVGDFNNDGLADLACFYAMPFNIFSV